jgi:hypothetical protein
VASVMKINLAGRSYLFSEDTSDNVELMALEELTGWSMGELSERLSTGSVKAITAIVWLLRRREEPGLPFADVKFRTSDISVELIDDEGNDEGLSLES